MPPRDPRAIAQPGTSGIMTRRPGTSTPSPFSGPRAKSATGLPMNLQIVGPTRPHVGRVIGIAQSRKIVGTHAHRED